MGLLADDRWRDEWGAVLSLGAPWWLGLIQRIPLFCAELRWRGRGPEGRVQERLQRRLLAVGGAGSVPVRAVAKRLEGDGGAGGSGLGHD